VHGAVILEFDLGFLRDNIVGACQCRGSSAERYYFTDSSIYAPKPTNAIPAKMSIALLARV
jgi:hypothetical protein